MLAFFSSLLKGYRKYVVFVDREPFFNKNGFLATKGPDSRQLLHQIVGPANNDNINMGFYMYLCSDVVKGPIHTYIDSPSPATLREIHVLEDVDVFAYRICAGGEHPKVPRRKVELARPTRKNAVYNTPLNKFVINLQAHSRPTFERSQNFLDVCSTRKTVPLPESLSK